MTRKDFELIAKCIRSAVNDLNSPEQTEQREMHGGSAREQFEIAKNARRYELQKVANYFAATLSHTNARFDRQRFLNACGMSF